MAEPIGYEEPIVSEPQVEQAIEPQTAPVEEQAEQPIAETPKEEVQSETTPETNSDSIDIVETVSDTTKEPEINWEEKYKELESVKAQEKAYSNKFIATLDNLERSGTNVTPELVSFLKADFDSIDLKDHNQAKSILAQGLKDKGLVDVEIEAELEQYDFDGLDKDDRDYKILEARLIRNATEIKNSLKSKQEEFLSKAPEQFVDRGEQEKVQKETISAINTDIANAVSSFNHSVKVGETDVSLQLPDELKKEHESYMQGLLTDGSKFGYTDKEGRTDMQRFNYDQAWANPKTRSFMLKKLFASVKSQGQYELDKQRSNVDFSQEAKPKDATSEDMHYFKQLHNIK